MKEGIYVIISGLLAPDPGISPETAAYPCPPPAAINLGPPALDVFITGMLACSLIVGCAPICNLLVSDTPDGPPSPIPPRFAPIPL